MTESQKKEKILAAIAARGWHTRGVYEKQAMELYQAGVIKIGNRFSTGGNRKAVWVSA